MEYLSKQRYDEIAAVRKTEYPDLMAEYENPIPRGEGNFFDGWMKNPMSAMISCNDGFRPVSFYLEVLEVHPTPVTSKL
jgi:hypothetical protein